MSRETPFTPTEALRAMIDNIECGQAAMEGLELRTNHGGTGDWREPITGQATIEVASLISGRVQIRRKLAPTPAQKAGWSEGDVGKVKTTGRLVLLQEDDRSRMPYWRHLDVGTAAVYGLADVERLIPESECIPIQRGPGGRL